jgi:RNA polymerase sporulation-specific sigma factor
MRKLDELVINENKKMIYKIATEFNSKGYDLEDLYQIGVIAISKALENFDETYDTKFSTYAYIYIRGEMAKYVREDRNIKTNPDNLKVFRAYKKAKEFLEQKYFKTPSFKEICDFMNVEEEKLYNSLTSCEFTSSLEENIGEDRTYYDVISSSTEENLDEMIMIKDAINNLSEFEKKLINCRIYKDYTQSETAKILGVSQVQISRYENSIYSRMRKKLEVS